MMSIKLRYKMIALADANKHKSKTWKLILFALCYGAEMSDIRKMLKHKIVRQTTL